MRPSIAALTYNWTSDAAHTHTIAPTIATLRLHLVACKLLLISRPVEDRRLSWPEHMVGNQLAEGCLQMTRSEIRTAT